MTLKARIGYVAAIIGIVAIIGTPVAVIVAPNSTCVLAGALIGLVCYGIVMATPKS